MKFYRAEVLIADHDDTDLESVMSTITKVEGNTKVHVVKLQREETSFSPFDGRTVTTETLFPTGETSDGYHTFNELYDHRHHLFVTLMSLLPRISWWSRLHHDGTSFDGWILAGIDLPSGTITYHIPSSMVRLLDYDKELSRGKKWDGHTSQDVIKRLSEYCKFRQLPIALDNRRYACVSRDLTFDESAMLESELLKYHNTRSIYDTCIAFGAKSMGSISPTSEKEKAYESGFYDGRHGTPCEQIRAQNENEQLTDIVDLMRDEFRRIMVCPDVSIEVIGLCERAITCINQNVPVIVQRDNAEAELAKIKCLLSQLGELL